MEIFNTFFDSVNSAVDTISDVAQSFVEKNTNKAKLNRLRLVMKTESELMNRAYIALGKHYYETQKKGIETKVDNEEQLFDVIEKSKAKIAKARDCYRKIVDSQNDYIYRSVEKEEAKENNDYNDDDVVDITVACSNEGEYKSSPFDAAAEKQAKENADNNEPKPEQTAEADDKKAEKTSEGESPESELF